MTIVKTSGGCGCGGGSGSSCGCGSSSCGCRDVVRTAGQSFVRPRFFPGQLLTDEDLDLLQDYVTAKNRLHNRYMFGQGVVCGLQVLCDPCDRELIRLQAGYALDCCGNDIVVPCDESIDVAALISQLSKAKHDCTDPCASNASDRTRDPDDPDDPDVRHYGIYIHYAEEATDAVAPYVTDPTCHDPGCEATRVREGYRFEARCGCEHCDTEVTILDHIRACFGDLGDLYSKTSDAAQAAAYGKAMRRAATISTPGSISVGSDDAQSILEIVDRMDTFDIESADKVAVAGAADDARLLAAKMARVQLARSDAPALVDAAGIDWVRTHELLATRSAEIRTSGPFSELPPLTQFSMEALERSVPRLETPTTPDEVALSSPEHLSMVVGLPTDTTSIEKTTRWAAGPRDWLLARLDDRESATACELRRQLEGLRFRADLRGLAHDLTFLRRAVVRLLVECICDAVHPPCPACDDPGVLLACVKVRGCEVIDICNSPRCHVITGPALRYWFPIRTGFGKFCCEIDDLLAKSVEAEETPVSNQIDENLFTYREPFSAGRSLVGLPQPIAQVLDLATPVTELVTNDVFLRSEGLRDISTLTPRLMNLARTGVDDRVMPLVDNEIRDRLRPMLKAEMEPTLNQVLTSRLPTIVDTVRRDAGMVSRSTFDEALDRGLQHERELAKSREKTIENRATKRAEAMVADMASTIELLTARIVELEHGPGETGGEVG